MAKPSRNNRGATKDITRADWRTPPELYAALQERFGVQCVVDAAADANNALAAVHITKAMNTLQMPIDKIQEIYAAGVRIFRQNQVDTKKMNRPLGIWCNPEYNDTDELDAWIDKGARHSAGYGVPWIFLLPSSRSEQDWWHRAIRWRPRLCYPKGRVRYRYPDGTPGESPNHPSVGICFGLPDDGTYPISTLIQSWRAGEAKKPLQ